jgi:hypothetical protein
MAFYPYASLVRLYTQLREKNSSYKQFTPGLLLLKEYLEVKMPLQKQGFLQKSMPLVKADCPLVLRHHRQAELLAAQPLCSSLCVYNSETTPPYNLECRAEEKMAC